MTVELVSATTLIKDALGTSAGLVNWAVNTTAEAAFDRHKILTQFVEDGDREGAVKWLRDQRWQKTGAAAARGTDVHRVAEALHLGEVVEYVEEIEPYVVQYRRFLEDFEPQFLLAEAPCYNRTFAYAGTLDGVAIIEGKPVVVDLKTTAHSPDSGKSRPPFPETAVQLTLYRNAEHVGLLADRREVQYRRYYSLTPEAEANLEPMPETEGGVVVVVSPFDYFVVPVDTSERMWKVCRHIIQVAKFQTELSKTVFGPVISPPGRVAA